MPYPDDFTADELDQLFGELDEISTRQQIFRQEATPQQASIAGQLFQHSPFASPNLLEPVSRAVANNEMPIDVAEETLLETQKLEFSRPPEEKRQGGFLSRLQEGVMDRVKTGSRWTFAAANLLPQLVTNAGARLYSGLGGPSESGAANWERPDTGVFDGWFVSTDLGSMLAGQDAGEGFFIGEKAWEYQRRKAREYRGTIGGKGWTFGRGVANIGFQPDTKAYNILSGLVDATMAIAVPAVPFATPIKAGASAGRQALAGSGASPLARRSLAGLTNFSDAQILRSKIPRWLESADGQKVTNYLAKEVNDVERALEVFGDTDSNFLLEVARTKEVGDMQALLAKELGVTVRSADAVKMKTFDPGAMRSAWRSSRAGTGVRLARQRLGAKVGLGEVSLDFADEYARNDSLKTVLNMMKTLRLEKWTRLDGTEVTRSELMDRLARVVSLEDPGDFRNVMDEIDEAIAFSIGNTTRARRAKTLVGESGENTQQAARAVLKRFRDNQESHLYGAIHPEGGTHGFGLADALKGTDNTDVVMFDAKVVGGDGESVLAMFPDATAATLGEQKRLAARLPDIRALRRETSRAAFLFSKKFDPETGAIGNPQGWVTMLDFLQNKVWRTGTLMTGGYALRNISESMVRSALAPGIRTGPTHPLEWIMAMSKRRVFGSIDGLKWTDEALNVEGARMMREYADAMGTSMREAMDAAQLQYKAHQTGAWRIARAGDDRNLYRQGIQDQVHVLSRDPVMRLVARGADNEEIFAFLRNTPEGQMAARATQARWTNKRPVNSTDNSTRVTYTFIKDDGDLHVQNWEKLIDEYYVKRLEYETGGSRELKDIIGSESAQGEFLGATGKLSAFKTGRVTPAGEPELMGYTKEFDELVNNLIDTNPNMPKAVKHRVHSKQRGLGEFDQSNNQLAQAFNRTTQHFFTNVFGRKEAFLNRSPAFRQFYYKQVDNLVDDISQEGAAKIVENIKEGYVTEINDTLESLKRIKPNKNGVYEVGSETLNKKAYQARVKEVEAQKAAKLAGFDDAYGARYVGSKQLWQKINDRASGRLPEPANALDFDQVSLASRGYAMEEVKRLFYNASETSNFADILRIISPFGQAWGEVMKAWYKQVLLDPNKVKNMGFSMRGIRDSDPDGDGKSVVYKDPVTGEMMINYPFQPAMAPLLLGFGTGLAAQTVFGKKGGMLGSNAGVLGGIAGAAYGAYVSDQAQTGGLQPQLTAPVKSLNMALNVLPSAGPVVQIAANQILGKRPEYDDLRSFILPYGAVEPTPEGLASAVTPSWAKKLLQAISADPETDRMFADLYIDSVRALMATGNYDNRDPASMQELENDAAVAARYLLAMRTIGQFVGPARPDVVLQVPTKFEGEITIDDVTYLVKDGNIPNNVLSKAFRYFQEEDFENAVPRFMQTFGDDTFLYVRGATTAISKGLDASEEFGDWERRNGQFRARHTDVFGYFADVGTQFDLETYLRQIKTGDRQRTSDPEELIADAEATVGKAMYRQQVRKYNEIYGGDLPDNVTAALKAYKAFLFEALPGYSTAPLDINEQADTIRKLELAARDPLMGDNDIAKAARLYFDNRQQAIDIAQARRVQEGRQPVLANPLSGKANADLRAFLRHTGEVLVDQYPDFERVFSRELFNEIDVEF